MKFAFVVVLTFVSVGLPSISNAASPEERPNILVLMGDDWSWPHAGFLGDPVVKTPTFDRLAAGGVVFKHAFVSAPSCTPSRFAIATGQWHWRLEAGSNLGGSLKADVPVYADLLKKVGYDVGYSRKGAAPSKRLHRSTDPFGTKHRNFADFLKQRKADQPFCFWYGAGEPHRPYRFGIGETNGLKPADVKLPACLPDDELVRRDVCDYYHDIQRFDSASDRMIELLKAAGELDNTLIVVSGDNGMPFPRCKATLYDMGTRVPLVIYWPARVKAGRQFSDFVSLTDLAPTFLEAAGVEIPQTMTGRSLLPIVTSDQTGQGETQRTFVLTGMERHVYPYPSRAIRTGEFLYIRNFEPQKWPTGKAKRPTPAINFTDKSWPTFPGAFSFNIDPSPTKQLMLKHRGDSKFKDLCDLAFATHPPEELYDMKNDPGQVRNVVEDTAYSKQLSNLRKQLEVELRSSGDPRFITDQP